MSRADWCCSNCDSSQLHLEQGTDGIYQCKECGTKTHEKIEEQRETLEGLADDDIPASRLADLLIGGGQ